MRRCPPLTDHNLGESEDGLSLFSFGVFFIARKRGDVVYFFPKITKGGEFHGGGTAGIEAESREPGGGAGCGRDYGFLCAGSGYSEPGLVIG